MGEVKWKIELFEMHEEGPIKELFFDVLINTLIQNDGPQP